MIYLRSIKVIARRVPQILPTLLELTKNDSHMRSKFITALCLQNEQKWTAFQMIAQYAPESLASLIELAQHDPDLQTALGLPTAAAATSTVKEKLAALQAEDPEPHLIATPPADGKPVSP